MRALEEAVDPWGQRLGRSLRTGIDPAPPHSAVALSKRKLPRPSMAADQPDVPEHFSIQCGGLAAQNRLPSFAHCAGLVFTSKLPLSLDQLKRYGPAPNTGGRTWKSRPLKASSAGLDT